MLFGIETLIDLDISVGMAGSDENIVMLQSWCYIWLRECRTYKAFLQWTCVVGLHGCVQGLLQKKKTWGGLKCTQEAEWAEIAKTEADKFLILIEKPRGFQLRMTRVPPPSGAVRCESRLFEMIIY